MLATPTMRPCLPARSAIGVERSTWIACGPGRDGGRRAGTWNSAAGGRAAVRPCCRSSGCPGTAGRRAGWRGRKRLGRPPGWRIVKSGAGRDRRRLSLWPRQRCANQRTMHRPFFAIFLAISRRRRRRRPRGPSLPASAVDRRISRSNWSSAGSSAACVGASGGNCGSSRSIIGSSNAWPLPPSGSSCGTRFGAPAATWA